MPKEGPILRAGPREAPVRPRGLMDDQPALGDSPKTTTEVLRSPQAPDGALGSRLERSLTVRDLYV